MARKTGEVATGRTRNRQDLETDRTGDRQDWNKWHGRQVGWKTGRTGDMRDCKQVSTDEH